MTQPAGAPEPLSPRPRALCLHCDDNVVTMVEDALPGLVDLLGGAVGRELAVVEQVAQSHKVACRPIAAGEAVVKYGVTIGLATIDIAAGQWVHTHNCRSRFDERSATLDLHTGAPTDTSYE